MASIESVPFEEVPAVQVASRGPITHVVGLNRINDAMTRASGAFRRAEEAPDDVASLRRSVNDLSDAVRTLSAELYNLTAGVRDGLIAVEPVDIES